MAGPRAFPRHTNPLALTTPSLRLQSGLRLRLALGLVLGLVLALCVGPCGAQRLFSFGDSLLDVGNAAFLKAGQGSQASSNFPPYGMSLTPPRVTGRFSNGMVFADYLGERRQSASRKETPSHS